MKYSVLLQSFTAFQDHKQGYWQQTQKFEKKSFSKLQTRVCDNSWSKTIFFFEKRAVIASPFEMLGVKGWGWIRGRNSLWEKVGSVKERGGHVTGPTVAWRVPVTVKLTESVLGVHTAAANWHRLDFYMKNDPWEQGPVRRTHRLFVVPACSCQSKINPRQRGEREEKRKTGRVITELARR